MATKQAPKGGSGEQKKAAAPLQEVKQAPKGGSAEQKNIAVPPQEAKEKQAPKGGNGEQKKAAVPAQESKEKESAIKKEPAKDDKANPKVGGKDMPKENKDANKKPVDKKESGPSGGSGGSHERGRGGRQDDHSRGKDRGRRSSRDRPDRRSNDKDDREVCRNFLHNRCDRGSLCKYYHPRSTSRPRHGPDDPEHRRSSPTRGSGTIGGQIVCRDFIRNMCTRGTECRFYHPPSESSGKKRQGSWLTFCHDFRNGHCLRTDCRFFHITRDDEESYRATGDIPLQIVDQAVRKAMVLDGALTGTRPTCKEFLRGLCNMQNCRFRHLSQREYEDEVFHALQEEFENILGPPDRRPNSPQMGNPYGSIGSFHDSLRDDVMPPDDMRGPLMPMSEYESEPKRPRYFSGDGMFPGEDYREGEAPRKWDERMDYDHMERTELTPRDAYRLQQEVYALRNEIAELRRSAERDINELKEEVRRAMEENVGLRHEVAKVRSTASEDTLAQKSTIDKLTMTNNTLMEDFRKAEERTRQMEHENREKLKAMDAKQKNNTVELERKLDSLQKEAAQLHDALAKATAMQKKTEDEKARLLADLDDMRVKMRNPQQQRRPPDMRDQDMRSISMRGSERYSPDTWGGGDKNGRAQYDDNSSGYGPERDQSRSWHGAPPPQDSWSAHSNTKASSGSLMGEYQGDDRMRGHTQNASHIRGPHGSGLLSLPMEVADYSKSSARTPQSGQMGMEGQYTGQGMMHYDEREYNQSGYSTDNRGGQFGHSQRSSSGWQQGSGDGGRGRGINQGWRREKQF